MADLLTRLDFFDIGRRFVTTRAKRIDPEQVNVEGSDANIFVGSMAFVAQGVIRQLGDRVRALFLDSAEREDLDRYAFDRYMVTRKGAAAALGEVRFFRSKSGVEGTIPIGTKVLSLTGIEYVTLTNATFAAEDLSKKANVRSVQAGKEYQVGANQIRRVDKPAILFDPSVQVNNDEKTAGGEPREPDSEFRERVRETFVTARRGTRSAIEYGARAVEGVATAQAVEAITTGGRPARVVQLFIADSSGVANAALCAQVEANLDEYRACGIAVIMSRSVPEIVDVLLRLSFVAGVDSPTLTDVIRAAVVGFINNLGVNRTLFRADLYSVLSHYVTNGLIVHDETIVAPAGDLVPRQGTTLRTTITNVRAL